MGATVTRLLLALVCLCLVVSCGLLNRAAAGAGDQVAAQPATQRAAEAADDATLAWLAWLLFGVSAADNVRQRRKVKRAATAR